MTETLAAMPAEEMAEKGLGQSFWQIVRRAFFHRYLHRLAVAYVITLGIIAIIVPLIANGRPYTAVVDGARVFPLVRSLTRVDWIVFLCAAGGVVYAAVYRMLHRVGDPELTARRRLQALLIVVGATVLGSAAIGFIKKDYNDLLHREDYKRLTPDYDVRSAIFPPLDWGFDDREFPHREEALFLNPSAEHPLGTDGSGRDTLSRMLWGVRIVFGIGLISQFIAFVIGVTYGAMMGYFGGVIDIYGSRFIEMVESIPTFFLLITFVALFGRQIFIIMVILGLVGWTGMARFVRAEFLKLRKADFVQAAIASGLPLRSVLFRHILPNCLTPVLVNVTFGIAGAVTLESSLSFLGLGVVPPTPSWGSILQEAGRPGSIFHATLAMAPGVMIFLTIFAYNVIGEGLRDAIDPRLNKMR